jgi:diguanylate cyclase (GGDEF)-like protein/PAS domain S-box-containing protein
LEQFNDSLIKHMVQTLSEHSLNGVFVIGESGILYTNKGFARMFGYHRSDILDKKITFRELVVPEHFIIIHENVKKHLLGETVGSSFKVTGIRENGDYIFLNILISSDVYQNQHIVVGSVIDITENVKTREHLNQMKQNYDALFENDENGIYSLDLNGYITDLNPAFEQMTGYAADELMHNHFSLLENPERLQTSLERFHRLLQSGSTQVNEVQMYHKSGSIIEISLVSVPVIEKRKIRRIINIATDITEKKKAEKEIHYAAYYDFLTGLPNRRMFEEQLDKRLRLAEFFHKKLALLLIDVDRLRLMNNSLGHRIGDILLGQLADRLQSCLGEGQSVYRMAGDKYGIVLEDVRNHQEVVSFTEKIFQAAREPFQIQGHHLNITVSMGIAVSPEDGSTLDQLYKSAVTALYYAETQGRDRAHIYSSSLSVQSFRLFSLINDLPNALEQEQLFLQYMPRVDTETTRIVGVEALLRWHHPDWGLVSPAEFIPIAEETGLILSIGEWTLREACKQNKKWRDMGYPPIMVAVNFSALQLLEQNILRTIDQILEETGLPSDQLEIELTEGIFISNEREVVQLLLELKKRKIKVSLDDFGTGYSSLYSLKRLKVDTLKIDKSFVQEILTDSVNQSIIQSIMSLAKMLEMSVVAEGVETIEQYTYLKEQDCDEIQGYYFSRPLDAEELIPLLKDQYVFHQSSAMKQAEPCINRRKYFRIELEYALIGEMTISMFKGRKVELGSTEIFIKNIGPSGLRFLMGVKLPVNNDIILKFKTEILSLAHELEGTVVWFNEVISGEVYEYGVQFLIEENEQSDLIENLNQLSIKLREGHPPHTQLFIGDPVIELRNRLRLQKT